MPADTEIIEQTSAPSESGLSKFMADVTSGIEEDSGKEGIETSPQKPESKPAAPAKPVEKQAESKPAAKLAAPKADKPAAPADKAKPEDMNSLRKRYEEVNGELAKERQTKTQEISALQKKLDDLSKKRFWSDDDDKKVSSYEEQIAELKKQLAETSYERSDEYNQKFKKPWQTTLDHALNLVQQIKVVEGDGFRAGTKSDFWKVAGAPVEDQAAIAQQLFGVNAIRVLQIVDKLSDIKQQAEAAVEGHNQTAEAKAKEQADLTRKEQQTYEAAHATAAQELETQFPQFFGKPEDDPELTKQMEHGYDFVDRASKEASKLPPVERAEYAAVVRARAAAFPRLVFESRRAADKIAALEAELAKFRGSTPGTGRGDSAPAKEESAVPTGGTAALVKEFD